METINERLAMLPDLLGYDSPAALAKAMGLDPNTVRKAMQGPSKPSFDTLEAITKKHPKLNPDWLLLGNGEPLRDGRTLSQLPPPVPSHFEEAKPGKGYFTVTSDNEELRQVKDERDNLRRQVDRLLGLLEANTYGAPLAAGGKAEASADAATSIYATVDRLCVNGLKRYPEHQEEAAEAPHYDLLTGQRKQAA